MIGVADQKLWNLGVGLSNGIYRECEIVPRSMLSAHQHVFLVYAP